MKKKITPEIQEPAVAPAISDITSTDIAPAPAVDAAPAPAVDAASAASSEGGSNAEIKRRKKTFYRKFNSKKSMKRKNKTNRNK